MIKVIAFDLVGVLVSEKDIELSLIEDRLERLFGPNLSDADYLEKAKTITNDEKIINITEEIIDKLYKIRDKDLFRKIKEKYPNCKVVIATNHVSYVKRFIEKYFDNNYLDDIIISAEIERIKPNEDFYQYLLEKYDIDAGEMLFLDDNTQNVESANKIGIRTIKVDRKMDLFTEIVDYLK